MFPSLVKPTFSVRSAREKLPAFRGLPQRHFASALARTSAGVSVQDRRSFTALRTSPVAGWPAEGLLTEPTAVARPRGRGLLFLPHCSHCPGRTRTAQQGGPEPCPIFRAYHPQASKASFTGRSQDTRSCTYFGAAAGRPEGRRISSSSRGCRFSEPRIIAWTWRRGCRIWTLSAMYR